MCEIIFCNIDLNIDIFLHVIASQATVFKIKQNGPFKIITKFQLKFLFKFF